MFLQERRLRHAALGLAAFAANPDLGQVAAGPPLVDPQLAPLGRAVTLAAVDEIVPVDVPDMAVAAGPHEADRDDRPLLLVPVEELPVRQRLAVDQQSRALRGSRIARLDILGDEPFRELEAVDAGRG